MHDRIVAPEQLPIFSIGEKRGTLLTEPGLGQARLLFHDVQKNPYCIQYVGLLHDGSTSIDLQVGEGTALIDLNQGLQAVLANPHTITHRAIARRMRENYRHVARSLTIDSHIPLTLTACHGLAMETVVDCLFPQTGQEEFLYQYGWKGYGSRGSYMHQVRGLVIPKDRTELV
ncbi:MAG: hypothetical protein NUV52_00810 [Candidatus Roizmanbacteria bacterium]|nr:hypothetical protein [Candidatus Roizmanbacteria bacterium]